MHEAGLEPQRVRGTGWWTDLERRPAFVIQQASPVAGTVFLALGLGALSLSAAFGLVIAPRHWNEGGADLVEAVIPALMFLGGGLYFLLSGLRYLERRQIVFREESVEVEGRDLRGRLSFSAPYSSFDGVQLRVHHLPKKVGVTVITTVQLVHPDPRRTLRLLSHESRGQNAGPTAREALARYAELLGVPALPDASPLTRQGRTRTV